MELSKEAQAWFERPLPDEFFKDAGLFYVTKRTAWFFGKMRVKKHVKKRWKEIPEEWRQLASLIIHLAHENRKRRGPHGTMPYSCTYFRQMLYLAVKKIEENHGIKLPLPHAWFMDGVMIEPEWIVRITNGIVGWSCDESQKICGFTPAEDSSRYCMFYQPLEVIENAGRREAAAVPKVS